MKKLLANLNKDPLNKKYLDSLTIEDMKYILTLNPNKLTGGKNITGIKNELLLKNFQVTSQLSIWIENHIDYLNNYFLSNQIYQYSPLITLNKINNTLLTKDNYYNLLSIKIFSKEGIKN